ncbi:NAD(P)-dependent alcohol dehydrogenase [Dactylosporangium vinaceum]|uniref:NAD(P)-dependent alcohol dehydrogenase n=1 Tax=Dactylosporangium vinaceum TaxID=53362 RepID=A0ABV5MM58_9ACTN|nr:NAD(P)-dependent alcohol dehydrogenase [Dactylosporangium vinaceum]UAB93333.1 NAD(P)-dependent alcohol dehydrogenase [Dactylosporangium vinaceum]
MKAVVRERYGAALEVRDVATPEIGERGVLVAVRAAGVDQGVWHLATGRPYLIRAAGFGLRRPRVAGLGMDVAGVVAAVGAQVTRLRVGDEVFGVGDATFAEYAASDEDRLALKPANVSFVQAGAAACSGVAALQGLRDKAEVRPGQRVLVLGAGGGVGSFAVQMAKCLGSEVTAVCSTGKVELVRSLGAACVVDYAAGEPRGTWDVIIDTGGGRSLSALRRLLGPAGTLVIVGSEQGGGKWLQGTDRQLRAGLLSPFTRQRLTGLMSKIAAEPLNTLRDWMADSAVVPVVDRTFPLADTAAAIEHLRTGHPGGKVVLTV